MEARKEKAMMIKSHKLIISRLIAKHVVGGIRGKTVEKMKEEGFFGGDIGLDLELKQVPFIVGEVNQRLEFRSQAFQMLDGILTQSLSGLLGFYSQSVAQKKEAIFQKKERERMAQEEMEAERLRRKQERERRREEARQAKIRDEIKEKLLSKAEVKEALSEARISDINGSGNTSTPYVGFFGGVLQEAITFLNFIRNIENDKGFAVVYKKPENLTKIFNMVADFYLKMGKISVSISPELAAEYQKEDDEEFKLISVMKSKSSKAKAAIKEQILSNFNFSPALSILCSSEANRETFSALLARMWDLFDDEEIEIELNSSQILEKYDGTALVTVAPTLEYFKRQTTEEEEEEEGEREELPESLLNVDLETKFSLFPVSEEELKVLVFHKAVQINSQREILSNILEAFKLKNDESELLASVQEISEAFEKEVRENLVEKMVVPMITDSY